MLIQQDYAAVLFEQGFQQIYLVTGSPEKFLTKPAWVTDVLMKEPPF